MKRLLATLLAVACTSGSLLADPSLAAAAKSTIIAEGKKLAQDGGPRFRATVFPFELEPATQEQSVALYLQQQNQYSLLVAGEEGETELKFALVTESGVGIPLHLTRRHGGGFYVLTVRPPVTGNFRLIVTGAAGNYCLGYGYR